MAMIFSENLPLQGENFSFLIINIKNLSKFRIRISIVNVEQVKHIFTLTQCNTLPLNINAKLLLGKNILFACNCCGLAHYCLVYWSI
jgi:hypothetical protein